MDAWHDGVMIKRIAVGLLLLTPLATSALTEQEIRTQIEALLQQIQALQVQLQTQTTNTSTGMYCPTITRTLQRGDRDGTTNGEVMELQKFLAGYYSIEPSTIITGYFGSITEGRVRQFQAEKGITQTGAVGPLTRAALQAACGTNTVQTTTAYTTTTGNSCIFNGQTLLHGSAVTAYQSPNVSGMSLCRSEARTCFNGVLQGSYLYASCMSEPIVNLSCSFGSQTVAHGSVVIGYSAATVPVGQTCVSQLRTCTNGTLSGSYQHSSCSVSETTNTTSTNTNTVSSSSGATCSLDGATVPHGKSRYFYRDAYNNPPSGGWTDGQCSTIGQVRACTNGTLSGDAIYAKNTCGNWSSSLAVAPPSGFAPLKVTLTVPHTPNTGGVFPTINFGDGQSYTPTGDSSNPRYYVEHTYNLAGTYTVTTSGGFSYDPHQTITVTVE